MDFETVNTAQAESSRHHPSRNVVLLPPTDLTGSACFAATIAGSARLQS
jgi:hypothetical protein